LFRDYLESFETLIASFPEQQLAGKTKGLFGETVIDPARFAPTEKEYKEEDVRSSLRLQLKAMKDLGASGFSPLLVEEVETDFHKALAESKITAAPKQSS
jgi:hypothetical protein